MPKYVDELAFVGTNQLKFSGFNPKSTISSHTDITMPHLNEYRARVVWEKLFFCSHEDFPLAMMDVRNQLKRDVYGEFIVSLKELKFALIQHDRDRAIELVQTLMEMVK